MPIIAKAPESKFNPAPEGLHAAVCCDVVELGAILNSFTNKLQDKVRLIWEIDELDPDTTLPFQASQTYTLSLHEKAKLTQHLEAWRGRKFTEDEKAGFDLEKLIGVGCQIQIVHNISHDKKTYANVQACVPLGKGMVAPKVSEQYQRVKNRRAPEPPAAHDDADGVPF